MSRGNPKKIPNYTISAINKQYARAVAEEFQGMLYCIINAKQLDRLSQEVRIQQRETDQKALARKGIEGFEPEHALSIHSDLESRIKIHDKKLKGKFTRGHKQELAKARIELMQSMYVNAYHDLYNGRRAIYNTGVEVIQTDRNQSITKQLSRHKKAIDKVRGRMSEMNTPFVISIAERYIGLGLELLDLIQEGSIGMMRAEEKFDCRRGYAFSTYAHYWIKQSIVRALADQSRLIRVPVHRVDDLAKVTRARQILTGKFGREPTYKEMGNSLGWPGDIVEAVLNCSHTPTSLDQEFGEDATLMEAVENRGLNGDKKTSQADYAEHERLQELMGRHIYERLTPREEKIIRLRVGLSGGRSHTLEEIGQQFSVTRERIRQIQAIALKKLKRPGRTTEALQSFCQG